MVVDVVLWGTTIGTVFGEEGRPYWSFQYDLEFLGSGIEVSPVMMPLRRAAYSFPELVGASFQGLPGLLADSLPDKYGNALIEEWLARQGRLPGSQTVLEKLCYVGSRGMGALEFRPRLGPVESRGAILEVSELVELANEILGKRNAFRTSMAGGRADAMKEILRVGTSAGGARAKAVVAFHPETLEVRSGQVEAGLGFDYWLIKFDGVAENRDHELNDPLGFGAIEYAYSLMAKAAGIEMTECRLLEEGGRRHFMTKRFDRYEGGKKLHMQTLGGLAHFDFHQAGANSYEQAMLLMKHLRMGHESVKEMYRRMVFNVMARNQDDHVKNIAFLMDRGGEWGLAPAYDVTYSYNPVGAWTSSHQMRVNGKRDGFERSDFLECARTVGVHVVTAKRIIEDVLGAVERWEEFAFEAQVPSEWVASVRAAHRLDW